MHIAYVRVLSFLVVEIGLGQMLRFIVFCGGLWHCIVVGVFACWRADA